MIPENQIYNADVKEILPQIEDLSVDLAIVDPPYFGVSRELWDRKWNSQHEYLLWTRSWIGELARVMRYSGSVYLYGCGKNLLTLAAVGQQMVECGFEYRQEIIVDKGIQSVAGRVSKTHKCFPMVTENLLYFVKDAKPFVRELLQIQQKELGYSAREMNLKMGFETNGGGNWTKYAGETRFPLLPTAEHWENLCQILHINLPYCKIGVTFSPQISVTNVWKDIDFYSEVRIHSTQKPISLARRLIDVSSYSGDLVLDLFCGSGNVSRASQDTSRRFIAVDLDADYCTMARAKCGLSAIVRGEE